MIYDRICFIGTGHVGKECLTILANNCDRGKLLCLSADERNSALMRVYSGKLGIEFRSFDKGSLTEFLVNLREKTLIFSAHNGYIFPKEVVQRENIRIINLHFAYLPDYRGCNIPSWVIYNQEKYGGATWHIVDSGIDTGRIIVQEKVTIKDDERALDLLMRIAGTGIDLLRKHVAKMLNDDYVLENYKKPECLYLASHVPNDGYLDISWSMEKAYAFLRAMDYGKLSVMPVPKIKLDGKVYGIESYKVRPRTFQKEEMCFIIKSVCKPEELYCKLKVM